VVLFYLEEAPKTRSSLVERLEAGEYILCAEGYLLALCRRGYIAYGLFVPDFLVDCPEVLRPVHHEFIHAGSDVTVAFQVGAELLGGKEYQGKYCREEHSVVSLSLCNTVGKVAVLTCARQASIS